MKTISHILFGLLFVLSYSSAAESSDDNNTMIIQKDSITRGTADASAQDIQIKKIDTLNSTGIFHPVNTIFLTNKYINRFDTPLEDTLISAQSYEILFPDEYCAYKIITYDTIIEYSPVPRNLPDECQQAINRAPSWLSASLYLNFINLNKVGLARQAAQEIINAPDKLVDEVAFLAAHLSAESFNDSRFRSDIGAITRNAEFIYRVADSVQYMKLIEYGAMAARDYYTSAKYRILNGTDSIWVEVPREIYYWYVVHPKMDQEGYYIKDNLNDNTQRTYGMSWREYLWNNSEPARDYTKVNITTSKGSIDTIPRFGELMKKPKVLWNRVRSYYSFLRPFKDSDDALNTIGNWASRAVPIDAKLPRAFQPNQIVFEHDGNCNEDVFLACAAARTALIPMVYLSSLCEDHVFGAIYDEGWNHFEFFRGGLQVPGNQAYGITNLQNKGGYGWVTSIVQGFRPDGWLFDLTGNYTNTATITLQIADKDGNPIDGARIGMFGAPCAYTNIGLSGYQWTDYSGMVSVPVGENKNYYYQIYHPNFGWYPDSTNAFFTINNPLPDYEYKLYPVTIPNYSMPVLDFTNMKPPDTSYYGIRIKWKAVEIVSAQNIRDSQRSRFAYWNGDKGRAAFFLCDSINFLKFIAGEHFECFNGYRNTSGGDLTMCVPAEGTWFAVFSNKLASTSLEYIESSCELLRNFKVSSITESRNCPEITISPNPFGEQCRIDVPEDTKYIEIINMFGSKVATVAYPFIWHPDINSENGIYYFRAVG
ncbi:MAG: type sorting protein, partial [Bacteroidota bacterium]|nr:type sorting protein [Bacteroidota bacterium]